LTDGVVLEVRFPGEIEYLYQSGSGEMGKKMSASFGFDRLFIPGFIWWLQTGYGLLWKG